MRNKLASLLLALLLFTPLLAQPVANITGPAEVPPGELTLISSEGSVGDNLLWIKPEGLTVVQVGCEPISQQLFFATTRVGRYEFILVVTDKDAQIAYHRHVVTIGKPPTPEPEPEPTPAPDPDPEPDPSPDPVPEPGRWGALTSVSKGNADSANDPETRALIKRVVGKRLEELKAECNSGRCPGLESVKLAISRSMDSVILNRTDRFAAWQVWRIGNSNFFSSQPVSNVLDYFAAVEAILKGL